MLINQLMKYQLIDINKLILKLYTKLSLTELEAMCLIQLFAMSDKGKAQLSYVQLRSRMSLNKKEIGDILISLTNKNFIELKTAEKNGKEIEIYDLTKAIEAFENYLINDEKEDEKKLKEQLGKEYIELLEHEFNRTLNSNEINIVLNSLINYSLEEINEAIYRVSGNGKLTINGLVDYFNTKRVMDKKVDEKDEKAIIDFFNSINKKSR